MRLPRKSVLILVPALTLLHFGTTFLLLGFWERALERPFGWPLASLSFALTVLTFPAEMFLRRDFTFGFIAIFLNSVLQAALLAWLILYVVRRGRLAVVMGLVIALLGLPALWYASANALATFQERRLAAAWREAFPRGPAIGQRLARRAGTPSAAQLETLADGATIRPWTSHSEIARVRAWLFREIQTPGDSIDLLTPETKNYLTAYRWELEEIEQQLLQRDPPRWEIDHESWKMPGFRIAYDLTAVLAAEALEAKRRGDNAEAERLLAALTPLVTELRRRPEYVSSNLAIGATTQALGVLRKLGTPSGALEALRFSPRHKMIEARQVEAATIGGMILRASFDDRWDDRGWAQRLLLSILVRPYLRLCAAGRIKSNLRDALFIRSYPRCRFEQEEVDEARVLFPWNPIDSGTYPVRATIRANRLLLDFEGTEKVLQVKQERLQVASPELARSFCPSGKWLLEPVEGALMLRYTLPVPEKSGGLPVRYEFRIASKKPDRPRSSAATSPATPSAPRARPSRPKRK